MVARLRSGVDLTSFTRRLCSFSLFAAALLKGGGMGRSVTIVETRREIETPRGFVCFAIHWLSRNENLPTMIFECFVLLTAGGRIGIRS